MRSVRNALLAAAVTALTLGACSGSDATSNTATSPPTDVAAAATGIRVVSPTEAAAILDAPPDDLVVLDVRTPEEFAGGHLEGAVLLDFYREDFADEVARLDPDVPYVLYCRSGNRSSQARVLMAELGFSAVDDVDGGIVAWQSAGLPVVTD